MNTQVTKIVLMALVAAVLAGCSATPPSEEAARPDVRAGSYERRVAMTTDEPERPADTVGQPIEEADEPARDEGREEELRAACASNLKQLGVVCKMYANENRDFFPAMDPRPGRLTPDVDAIYPEYLADPRVFGCPARHETSELRFVTSEEARAHIDDHSYWYLGYAMNDEAAALAFIAAYRKRAETGEAFEGDLESDAGVRIRRVREGIERFFITDINNVQASFIARSTIPVLVERPGAHEDGAHVLYMDGHVEFLKYPGHFPMSEEFIKGLESLDALESLSEYEEESDE
ncbi:MAG TPA: hypothetical protein HPP77_06520 [Candidatus Hydrogenedentes bacterium]|nr:hypothetical protein [Candidatus Hydrogenedentota bacterium]